MDDPKAIIRRRRWKAKVGKDYLVRYHREYYAKHKDKINSSFADWKKKHPEYYERQKQYRAQRAKLKAEYDRKRYLSPIGEKRRADALKFAKEHPERGQAYTAKRRALKAKASINLKGIKQFIASVKSRKTVPCYYCKKQTPTFGCHFDHIIPLSKGGMHSADNLCVSCQPCNCSKQDKLLGMWIINGQQVLPL